MTADFEDRELCLDGNCIGIIGPDGRCKVCGLAGAGTPPAPADDDDDDADDEAYDGDDDDEDVDDDELAAAAGDTDDAFEDDRQLCPDGSCIGIIGSDGKCKVCGRSPDS